MAHFNENDRERIIIMTPPTHDGISLFEQLLDQLAKEEAQALANWIDYGIVEKVRSEDHG